FHGRGESPAAGAVDHAGRDPRQRAIGVSVDLWRMGLSAARTVRRRPRHLAGQFYHPVGGAVVRDPRAPVPEISRARKYLALRRAADAATGGDRRADLAVVHAGIRA